MQVQDKNSEFLEILKEICTKEHISNISIENYSEAQTHIPDKDFDGFICIRVLHFLHIHDAESVIRNMQKYTKT
jgi:2-polyprenyl-3-methyl-5-hydroxy-6-metoxy-1,4-benzoquinol methylase